MYTKIQEFYLYVLVGPAIISVLWRILLSNTNWFYLYVLVGLAINITRRKTDNMEKSF